jgi:hypothetical protein
MTHMIYFCFETSSNSIVAEMLARESLPAQGERVVGTWDTNKIRGNKIRDLLNGAGFL